MLSVCIVNVCIVCTYDAIGVIFTEGGNAIEYVQYCCIVCGCIIAVLLNASVYTHVVPGRFGADFLQFTS